MIKLCVQLLEKRKNGVGSNKRVVVELGLAMDDAMQHVGADGGIVRVGENARGGEELDDGIRECQAGCVDEKVGNELAETFQHDQHGCQGLEKHREMGIVEGLQPGSLGETHEFEMEGRLDVDVQDSLRL